MAKLHKNIRGVFKSNKIIIIMVQPAEYILDTLDAEFWFSETSDIEVYSHPVCSYIVPCWRISVKWKLSTSWKVWLQNSVSVIVLILNCAATKYPLCAVLSCSGISIKWKLSTYWKYWLQNRVWQLWYWTVQPPSFLCIQYYHQDFQPCSILLNICW